MIRSLLRREDGVALPVAAGTMLILTLLVAAVFANAMQSTASANKDRNSKRALAAAEAGLQIANYRLNAVGPVPSACFTEVPVAVPAGTECPPAEVDLGNGEKATYYVTPHLPAGSTCGSVPGRIGSGVERCITATGIVNGVERRVQSRVLTTPKSPPLVKVEGIMGLDKIDIGNNAQIGGNLGTNGEIKITNNSVFKYAELAGGSATLNAKNVTSEGEPIIHASEFTMQLAPIEGTEKPCLTEVKQGCHNNIVLPTSVYQSATRDLNVTQDVVLPTGDYNFCRIQFNGGLIRAQANARVRVFVDAPDLVRPGSGCLSGGAPAYGSVDGKNGVTIGNRTDPPEWVEFYIYGWPTDSLYASQFGQSTITVGKNNLEANAFIYAPQTDVVVAKNDGIFEGAVAAREVNIKNNVLFNWDEDMKWIGFSSGLYDRQGWRECRDRPTNPADPESGC